MQQCECFLKFIAHDDIDSNCEVGYIYIYTDIYIYIYVDSS